MNKDRIAQCKKDIEALQKEPKKLEKKEGVVYFHEVEGHYYFMVTSNRGYWIKTGDERGKSGIGIYIGKDELEKVRDTITEVLGD